MSTLNLTLMNVSLCRFALPIEYEDLVNSNKTHRSKGIACAKTRSKHLLRVAVQGVLCTLVSRLSHTEIKGEAVGIALPASDGEISYHFEHTRFIEANLNADE